MAIKQVTVFIGNKEGRIEKVTEVLGKAMIDIVSLSLAEAVDFGLLRLIVADPEKTKDVLKEAGLTAKINHVIAIEIDNKTGSLHNLLTSLRDFNIEYMYLLNADKKASIVMRIKNYEDAEAVLCSQGFKVLSDSDISR